MAVGGEPAVAAGTAQPVVRTPNPISTAAFLICWIIRILVRERG
jgi:hypothetical protein